MSSTYQDIVTIASIVIIGFFAAISLFDRTKRERAKLASEETTELISILKEKIEALETRVKDAEDNAKIAKTQVEEVRKENNRLVEILQGRDQNTMKYQEMGLKAMETAFETHKAVLNNGHKIEAVNKNVERLALAIEKHLKKQEGA